MRKNIFTLLTVCAAMMTFMITGCGSSGSPTGSSPAAQTKVFGVASLDTTAVSAVSVKDSSVPPQEKAAALSSNGTFTADVRGLRAPFVLKATGTDQTGASLTLSSVSTNGGMANINQISDLAATAVTTTNSATAGLTIMAAYDSWSRSSYDDNRTTAYSFDKLIYSLRNVLAPLFSLYNVSGNAVSDDDENDYSGLSAMLQDVRFTTNNGKVLVTNRATGAVIFSGYLNNLSAGTFNSQNMPAGPGGSTGSTACTYAYSGWGVCDSTGNQARTVASSTPAGCTGTPLLSQTCTYVPPTPSPCTYTYGAWGACQSTNVQIRSLLSSSPAGCTGTPALSQSCTYVPPVTTCTSFTYSGWGACDLTGNQTRSVTSSSPAGCTGGTPALSQTCTYVPPACTYTYSGWGTCDSTGNQTRTVASSTPTGCAGTPLLSQTCTYVPPVTTCTSFTYSGWGTCQSNSTQTRTVTASSPSGCTGGTPVLSQSCVYTPPVTTCTSFTYSGWGACQSNSTQTRTVTASSPTGCTGGTPVLSQSCTYTPPSTLTLAQVTSSCTMCHGLTVNTTVLKSGGYTINGRTASSWLSTVNTMVGYGAPLASGTTAQDYANFLAALP